MLLSAVLFGLGLGIAWISDWQLHDGTTRTPRTGGSCCFR